MPRDDTMAVYTVTYLDKGKHTWKVQKGFILDSCTQIPITNGAVYVLFLFFLSMCVSVWLLAKYNVSVSKGIQPVNFWTSNFLFGGKLPSGMEASIFTKFRRGKGMRGCSKLLEQ